MMDEEQRRFWDDLLAYYRQELRERQSPAMVSMLGFFHGEEQALQDKCLAEEGHVYLLKGGRLLTKRIDELNPSDVPYLMAELEANEAMVEEHSVAEGDVTTTEVPGKGTFTHPHYEDATHHLRERWRELKGTWQARDSHRYHNSKVSYKTVSWSSLLRTTQLHSGGIDRGKRSRGAGDLDPPLTTESKIP